MSQNFSYKPLDSVYKPMNAREYDKPDEYQPRTDETSQEEYDGQTSRTPDTEL